MDKKALDKEKTQIELVTDQPTRQLLALAAHNWDVAASRMEMIAKERTQGLYDDSGTEVMAVFCRMERVGTILLALRNRPQALLLRGYRELLASIVGDHRMDREIASMLNPAASEMKIDTPSFWEKLKEIYHSYGHQAADDGAIVRNMFKTHLLPNMDDEDTFEWMRALSEPTEDDEEKKEAQHDIIEDLAYFGGNIEKVATHEKQRMAMGLLMTHQLAALLQQFADFREMDDEAVDALFESAKAEVLDSREWHNYWRDHQGHLALMSADGTLSDQLKADADEVEHKLLSLHGYLYNRWDESPEAFGRALKESGLSDEEMLNLLFLLAKKQSLEDEGESPDKRLRLMRQSVKPFADKLYDLAADKYEETYDAIWDDIVQNPIIGAQLAEYRSGRHNQGFNMQVFCNIAGWLMREKHFFGNHSSSDLGKKLGDRNNWETFRDYIKKTKTSLTEQSVSELSAILKKHDTH